MGLNTWQMRPLSSRWRLSGCERNRRNTVLEAHIYKDIQAVTLDPFSARSVTNYAYETMAVIPSPDHTELFVLLKNGVLETFSLVDGTRRSLTLNGNLRAMTLDEDDLWICSSDGYVHRVDTQSLSSVTKVVGTECYGPPVVDIARQQVIINGYEDYQLSSIRRSDLSIINTVETSRRVLRGAVVGDNCRSQRCKQIDPSAMHKPSSLSKSYR